MEGTDTPIDIKYRYYYPFWEDSIGMDYIYSLTTVQRNASMTHVLVAFDILNYIIMYYIYWYWSGKLNVSVKSILACHLK